MRNVGRAALIHFIPNRYNHALVPFNSDSDKKAGSISWQACQQTDISAWSLFFTCLACPQLLKAKSWKSIRNIRKISVGKETKWNIKPQFSTIVTTYSIDIERFHGFLVSNCVRGYNRTWYLLHEQQSKNWIRHFQVLSFAIGYLYIICNGKM